MRIPARQRSYGLRFNITPLIDVVFLLIIFFLVSSHFVRSETQTEVDLPEATKTEAEQDHTTQRLIITVTADGSYFVSGRRLALSDLKGVLINHGQHNAGDLEVRIRGDQRTEYRFIEPILLLCPQIGCNDIKCHVLSQGGR